MPTCNIQGENILQHTNYTETVTVENDETVTEEDYVRAI